MRLGLIGRSIGYSRSPEIYQTFFYRHKIEGQYHLIELTQIDQIEEILMYGGFTGLNVTIPYKSAIIPFLDKLSSEARDIQAVNCIARDGDQWVGHNTDIDGIRASLDYLKISSPLPVLILGNGAVTQAVKYVLSERNLKYAVVSRKEGDGLLAYSQIDRDTLSHHSLIINCTPVGTYPDVKKKIEIPYQHLTENHILFDLVYNPKVTAFMKEGMQRGSRVLGGMLMLKTQAQSAWKKWNHPQRP